MPAAIRPNSAQAVCEAVSRPWPRKLRIGVAVGRFAPAAGRLLMGQQPLGAGHHRRIVGRHADGRQPGQRLPGAVDVVDAPAAEPTAVGFLRAAKIGDGPIDRRIAHALARTGQRFQHAAGQVGRAGIDHRVVIGERHVAEELAVLSRSKAPQPPSRFCMASIQWLARWWRRQCRPAACAWRRASGNVGGCRFGNQVANSAAARRLRVAARRADTLPAAPSAPSPCRRSRDRTRWHIRSTSRPAAHSRFGPIAASANFLRQQPVHAAFQRRMRAVQAAVGQGPHRDRGVPHRRLARLQVARFGLLRSPGPPAARGSIAFRGCRRRSPAIRSATMLQIIGGKIAPRPSLPAKRSIIHARPRRLPICRSGSNRWRCNNLNS